jgi:hypothetical protein
LHEAFAEALVDAGQDTVGLLVSWTITFAEQLAEAPSLSVTVNFTSVVPSP